MMHHATEKLEYVSKINKIFKLYIQNKGSYADDLTGSSTIFYMRIL